MPYVEYRINTKVGEPRHLQLRVPHGPEHHRRTNIQRPLAVPRLSVDPLRLHLQRLGLEQRQKLPRFVKTDWSSESKTRQRS